VQSRQSKEDGSEVGCLPREIYRPCKFLLDRGASIVAKLTSEKYRRSPFKRIGNRLQVARVDECRTKKHETAEIVHEIRGF
jgi:hypothetical protein